MSESAEGIVEKGTVFRGKVHDTKRDWIILTGWMGPNFLASFFSEDKSQLTQPLAELKKKEHQNEQQDV